ncbi:hypothetical protein HHK36_009927 [Tetracentron sinense]|uniref:Pentatricopeptide repeat-containing protein n=1 Tax=Tetracentron sinense TaxID=13715 RepID=A0A835DIT4_TETSI|nr:hypothetical protein HHK36_009927 [Tetracentron sinense]
MVSDLRLRFLSASSLLHLIPALCRFWGSLSSTPHPLSLRDDQPRKNRSINDSTVQGATNFLHLLNLCRNMGDLKKMKSLLVVHGAIEDGFLVGEFFRVCFHLGTPEIALTTFQRIKNPSLFLQNLMIRRLSDYGLYEDLLVIYIRCQKSGCSSDNFTFPFVIKACAALPALRTGKEIHSVVLRAGFDHNLVIQTALVDMYAKTGHMGTSCLLLDKIPQPDLVSWNALLSGYSLNGLNHKAFEVFQKICDVGLKPNVSTLASIIPICTRLGSLDIGRSLHGFAVKSGLFLDQSLIPALISMYGGCGNLSIARKLFELLPEKNVVTWNAMISAYTQNGKSNEAFEMFWLMIQANMHPNMITFVSIIPSFDNPSSIWYGESVHTCGIKYGLEHQISVVTALVSMYAKIGDLGSAQFLFDRMPERNLLSWNSMVSGYVQNGLWDLGLAAFREMQFEEFIPDAISIVSILTACNRLEDTLLGKSAHAFGLRKGFDSNLNVSNALLAFYSDFSQLPSSIKLFHKMAIRNVVSWNTLISGSVRNGKTGDAVALLRQMQQEGVDFDLVTMISVLPSYCETENLVQGMAVHGHAIRTGYGSDISLVNALISMYVNCGDLDAGHLLFEVMPERSVVSWNALITGYRCHNLQKEIMVLFRQMIEEHQKPDHVTLLNILPMCWTQLQGKSIHAYAVRTGVVLESPFLTSLILMYDRFEKIGLCCLLFEMANKSNVSLWNTMMSVHVQSKNAKNAVASFHEMLRMKLEPDYITILALISACVQLSSLNLTHCVMAYTIRKGFEKDVLISNALIDLYARCGNISIARKLFDELIGKDAVSWSVMINGYGMHGDAEAALALFSRLKCSRVQPDDVTFISLLSACSHAGLVDQGRMLFRSMVDHGVVPRMEHYACMVDLLGRTGYLNEAYDLVKRLPFKPSASLLESLLGACRIHGNIELGEEISRSLFIMDPENSGSYVMLSNIYAAAGRWTDASRVRSYMEGRRLRKVPGFSLVEACSLTTSRDSVFRSKKHTKDISNELFLLLVDVTSATASALPP